VSQPDVCAAAVALAFSSLPRPAGLLTSITHSHLDLNSPRLTASRLVSNMASEMEFVPATETTAEITTETTNESNTLTRIKKGLAEYQGEGPKWRLGKPGSW
jgi:hypothetical protein